MNKTFCPYPFYHICTTSDSKFRLCCHSKDIETKEKYSIDEWWNSNEINDRRQQLLSGIPIPECSKCYKLEKENINSPRMAQLEQLNNKTKFADKKYSNINNWRKNYNVVPLSLDLRFSNKCNLKCRMCNPYSSSSVGDEIKKHKELTEIKEYYWPDFNNDFNDSLPPKYIFDNLNSIERLRITGGEPFYSPEFYELVNILEKTSLDRKIRIKVISNGSFFSNRIIEQISKSPIDMHLEISIDGINDEYNYIRYPAKWHRISKNLINFNNAKIPMNVTITVQILNIINIVEMLSWFDLHKIVWDGMLLDDPDIYNINWLPPKISNIVINDIEKYRINKTFTVEQECLLNNIINRLSVSKFDKVVCNQFLKVTSVYDKIRKQSFQEVHPILYNEINKLLH